MKKKTTALGRSVAQEILNDMNPVSGPVLDINTIVCKFGGSSLSCAAQVIKVIDIIKSDPRRRCIVVSAPGKRRYSDYKVTDLLLDEWTRKNATPIGATVSVHKEELFSRFAEIVEGLGIDFDIRSEFDQSFTAGLSWQGAPDFMMSRGEYLMAKILAKALDFDFIDAIDCIRMDNHGQPDLGNTYRILRTLPKDRKVVIPGFYGLPPSNALKTFSRGGSDITGAIVAAGVNAHLYENWTDVDGICMAHPGIVSYPRSIRNMTYRELREMTYMGASVYHPEAMFPVQQAGIPTMIRDTNNPDLDGTMITLADPREYSEWTITGIAGKRDFTVIAIEKERMNTQVGFVRDVLDVLANHGVSFEHMPSSADSISVIIDDENLVGVFGRDKYTHEEKVAQLRDLISGKDDGRVDSIHSYPMAMISLVGVGMVHRIGVLATAAKALADAGVNIRMVDQGSSEFTIVFGVEQPDFEKAIRALYSAFVRR